jgi:hypothetical protein
VYAPKFVAHLIDLPAALAVGPTAVLAEKLFTWGRLSVHCTAAGSNPGGDVSVRLTVTELEETFPEDRVKVSDFP